MALASPAADGKDPTRESLFCCLPGTIQDLFQGSSERCPTFVGSGHQEAAVGLDWTCVAAFFVLPLAG